MLVPPFYDPLDFDTLKTFLRAVAESISLPIVYYNVPGATGIRLTADQIAELGEIVWVVDLNRQSLDRVVPMMGATRLQGMFAAAGWQVLTVKYGRLLEELFARPGGGALRDRIDGMSNPEYQRLLRHDAADLRRLLPGEGPGAADVAALIADLPDDDLRAAVRNLMLWTRYPGTDPEANVIGISNSLATNQLENNFYDASDTFGLPLPRRLSLSVRVGY